MCRLRNIAMHDYKESVTTGQTDRRTPDKVIPMCRYASQATQKCYYRKKATPEKVIPIFPFAKCILTKSLQVTKLCIDIFLRKS